jgi:hypothetical protein
MMNVLAIVDLTEQKSKTALGKEKLEQLVEALVSLIFHFGMINFWAIPS